MKKDADDDMLPEYDFTGGVRGKYAARCAKGTNVVVLDPDVAAFFRDSKRLNGALRMLMEAASRGSPRTRGAKKRV